MLQAEDGIRDDLVTGVQTCALPILISIVDAKSNVNFYDEVLNSKKYYNYIIERVDKLKEIQTSLAYSVYRELSVESDIFSSASIIVMRSEERRVGKECRCRVRV